MEQDKPAIRIILEYLAEVESAHRRAVLENERLSQNLAKIYKTNAYRTYNRSKRVLNRLLEVFGYSRNHRMAMQSHSYHSKVISESDTTSQCLIDIGVHVHVFFLDCLLDIVRHLNNMPYSYSCYITTDTVEKQRVIDLILSELLEEKNVTILTCQNRGRDIGPWLIELGKLNSKHDIWCHVHTKKSIHLNTKGLMWRQHLLENLLGSRAGVTALLNMFCEQPQLGLVFPPFFEGIVDETNMRWDDMKSAQLFLKKLGYEDVVPELPEFSAGNMFWYRSEALQPLFDLGLDYEAFDEEEGQLKGTIMHMIERSIVYAAAAQGFTFEKCMMSSSDGTLREPTAPSAA